MLRISQCFRILYCAAEKRKYVATYFKKRSEFVTSKSNKLQLKCQKLRFVGRKNSKFMQQKSRKLRRAGR